MEDERQQYSMIKRILILTSIMLTTIISFAQTAQPQIEGFWGVKLGEPENTVVRKVRQSYPSADYDRSVNGKPFRVNNAKLAGLDVNSCDFKFINGILSEAKFTKGGGRFVDASQAQAYVNSLAQQAQNDYQEFCEAISSKYGTPKVSGQTVTWSTSNGNSIIIKPFTNTPGYIMDNGTTWAGAGIYIIYTYANGSHLNDF